MALAARGVTLLEGATVTAVEPGPTLVLADGRRIAGSHLLVAVGRRPNLAGAGSRRPATCRPARPASPPIAGLRSLTNRRVFAVGDIADPQGIGPRAFTHVGSYHAGIVDPPRAVPPAGADRLRRAAARHLHQTRNWRRSA